MALRVYPVIIDPNTSSSRTFDPITDVLVINDLATSSDEAISLSILDNVKGLIYLNNTDTTLGYLEDKVDSTYFIIDTTNSYLTIKDDSINADKIALDVDVSSKGFNADLIDGYHASEFARLSENNLFDGINTFNGNVVFNSDVEIQGSTYTNYANTLQFHGNYLQLNFNQGSTVPTYSGLKILRGTSNPSYLLVFDHSSTTFKAIKEDDGSMVPIEVPEPTDWHQSANKLYVDKQFHNLDATYLRIDGTNKATADIDFDNHKIVNVETPTDDQDVATKKYVDDAIAVGGNPDHSLLINRDIPNQHPISAITGLEDALKTAGVVSKHVTNGYASIIITDIPANTIVTQVVLKITTPYDNTEIIGIEIGDSTHPAIFMSVSENDPTQISTYLSYPYVSYSSNDNVILRFVGGIPTTGECDVFVSFGPVN